MLSLRYESWPVAALSRACGTNIAQPELPAKPGYGQQSDSHRDSDIKARAVSKIVSNEADAHPTHSRLARNVVRHGQNAKRAPMERSRVSELHYIVPIVNLTSIMERGILSHRRAETVDHASVADENIQDLRRNKRVPNGRLLHDYANTYFDARNPMMYKRLARRTELAVIRISPDILDIPGALITDGNAASGGTRFDPSPAGLTVLDEERVYAVSWMDSDTWAYYEKKRQRCAEVLVPDVIAPSFLIGGYVCEQAVLGPCRDAAPDLEVVVSRRVFF